MCDHCFNCAYLLDCDIEKHAKNGLCEKYECGWITKKRICDTLRVCDGNSIFRRPEEVQAKLNEITGCEVRVIRITIPKKGKKFHYYRYFLSKKKDGIKYDLEMVAKEDKYL